MSRYRPLWLLPYIEVFYKTCVIWSTSDSLWDDISIMCQVWGKKSRQICISFPSFNDSIFQSLIWVFYVARIYGSLVFLKWNKFQINLPNSTSLVRTSPSPSCYNNNILKCRWLKYFHICKTVSSIFSSNKDVHHDAIQF